MKRSFGMSSEEQTGSRQTQSSTSFLRQVQERFSKVSEFAEELRDSKDLLRYVARRFAATGSLETVAMELDLPSNTFDIIFAQNEDIENLLNGVVRDACERDLDRAAVVAAKRAITEIDKFLAAIRTDEERTPQVISACRAVLDYHRKQRGERRTIDEDIEEIYRALKGEKTGDFKYM